MNCYWLRLEKGLDRKIERGCGRGALYKPLPWIIENFELGGLSYPLAVQYSELNFKSLNFNWSKECCCTKELKKKWDKEGLWLSLIWIIQCQACAALQSSWRSKISVFQAAVNPVQNWGRKYRAIKNMRSQSLGYYNSSISESSYRRGPVFHTEYCLLLLFVYCRELQFMIEFSVFMGYRIHCVFRW